MIEVLDGRELGPSVVLCHPHHPLWHHAIEGGVFALASSDAASQDALDGAAVLNDVGIGKERTH